MIYETSPIIYKTKVIEAFDSNFSFPINLKNILKRNTFVSHIDKLSLLFSSEEMEVIQFLNTYFDFDVSIKDFVQINLFLFEKIKSLAQLKDNSLFLYQNGEVSIGKNIEENAVYLIADSVYVEKDSGGSLCKISYLDCEDLKRAYPIIVKIIESVISEYFLSKGFLPVHSSTAINSQTNEIYLSLGESRSGKTSYFTNNSNYKLIGDEYCFVREDRIIPFNLYYKSYCWEGEEYDEDFDGFKRKIHKLTKTPPSPLNSIDKILYIRTNSFDESKLIEDDNVKITLLMEYLSNFPGKIYLNDVKKYFPLVISSVQELLKIPVYLV